jgi:hypothetical protein
MLSKYEDSRDSFPEFRSFLRLLLRNKNSNYTVPVIEVVSLIKEYKPTVFWYLRREGSNELNLAIITSTTLPAEQAETRIDSLIQELEDRY